MGKLNAQQREAMLEVLPALRRFCLSLVGNGADADDLLQATVERVLSKGMPADAHPSKWMFRVCKNLWIDELRFKEVRTRMAPMVADNESGTVSLEQQADAEVRVQRVQRALERLPDEQRLALSLVAIEGMAYAEAAEILEVPVGTIMSRVARARHALVKLVGGNGGEH